MLPWHRVCHLWQAQREKKCTDDGESARGSAIVQKHGATFRREPLKLRRTQRSLRSTCIYMSKEKPVVGGIGAEWNVNKHRAPFRIKTFFY